MIDLHIHTNHSDGTASVQELLVNAEKQRLEIISITDHDTIDAYKELERNPKLRKNFKGKIVTGVELKAIYNKKNIEILGYGIDYKKIKIYKNDNLQQIILEHFKKVADKYKIKYDKNIALDSNNSKIFGSYVFACEILKHEENISRLQELGEQNLTSNNFFRKCESNPSSIFYFDASEYIKTIDEIVKDIHEAGGLAFLAHAYLYEFENPKQEIENIVENTEIDGLECQYPLFSKEQREEIISIAKKYNIYMSGGSDYHAKNKPNIRLGTGLENNLYIEKDFIKNWIHKVLE